MTCTPIESEEGAVVGHICDGLGGWEFSLGWCRWCSASHDDVRRTIKAEIYGGYCGYDYICGDCGYRWSSDLPLDPGDERHVLLVSRAGLIALLGR